MVSRASYYIKAFEYCLLYQFLLFYTLETAGKSHTLGKKLCCFLLSLQNTVAYMSAFYLNLVFVSPVSGMMMFV